MAAELPSPPPDNLRRSTRSGRGTGGRDVQLDKLGDVLATPTRKRKAKFAPDDPTLPVNPRTPQPKKKRQKKVFYWLLVDCIMDANLSALGASHTVPSRHPSSTAVAAAEFALAPIARTLTTTGTAVGTATVTRTCST